MISYGTNLTSTSDEMQHISLRQLYERVSHPDERLAVFVRQLRIVRTVDSKQYAQLKRRLPFVVCGVFNPSLRSIDNFAYTETFCLDIDHLSDKQIDLGTLRLRLDADPRVALSFVSPSLDGLKLFFRLSERCYDAGLYSLFYREFARRFSGQYGLEQVVDARTCDVSRACFLSVDEGAMLRDDSELVDWRSVIPADNPSDLFDLKHDHDKQQKAEATAAAADGGDKAEHDPADDVLARIRQTLVPKAAKAEAVRAEAFVPAILDELIDGLKTYIEKTGIEVGDVSNIQYAKKIRCRLGLRQAEINLFYGHHGFKVVKSPRSGTSAELNDVVAQLIEAYLREH